MRSRKPPEIPLPVNEWQSGLVSKHGAGCATLRQIYPVNRAGAVRRFSAMANRLVPCP